MKKIEGREPYSTRLDKSRKVPTREEQRKLLEEYLRALHEMGIRLPDRMTNDQIKKRGI